MSSIPSHTRRNIKHETLGKGEDLFLPGIAGCVCVCVCVRVFVCGLVRLTRIRGPGFGFSSRVILAKGLG